MISMWIVAAVLLTVAVVVLTSLPLLAPASGVTSATNSASSRESILADSKERGLRALKDLDFDYAMGKLSKDDYEQLRQSLTREVAAILTELKGHGQP
jgi:hypothetical protein